MNTCTTLVIYSVSRAIKAKRLIAGGGEVVRHMVNEQAS